ncbi:MAG: Co2+/Mg2+ efflux protein ApaG [Rhizobiales bacterium]|nr:Co2+/Mg2+ efflux protein ApaG [Hyphomicrobiales bacterium]
MYRAITHNIKVEVEPVYLDHKSNPDEKHYFWAYRVEIHNLSQVTVQLRDRYWKIADGNGHIEEVRGAGVVGEQPILQPGESFEYTSGCPLATPSGFMMGSYTMVSEDGGEFDVDIPAFSLDIPDEPRLLN